MNDNGALLQSAKHLGIRLTKRFPFMRWTRTAFWNLQELRYKRMAKGIPIEPKTVFFEAYGGRQYSCSPKAIYEEMLKDEKFHDWRFVWSFAPDQIDRASSIGALSRATLVQHGSPEYYRALASAKYWIQNNRVPEYVSPKMEQVYVQCWHGTPLKKLGFDAVGESKGGALNTAKELAERFKRDAKKWSYLVSPSRYTTEHLCSAFGLGYPPPSNLTVLEVGYPRNDALVYSKVPDETQEVEAKRLKAELGIDEGKKVLLYAPTWRDDSFAEGVGYTHNLLLDLSALKMELGQEWIVLIRAHYYIASKLDLTAYEGFALDVSEYSDINHLFLISDMLCTDYSSVMFDYAITRRPLLFYWPDVDHYQKSLHSFYLGEDELPGPRCECTDQLIIYIKDEAKYHEKYDASYASFARRFIPHADGLASERAICAIFCSI